jgi:hypothetical protein
MLRSQFFPEVLPSRFLVIPGRCGHLGEVCIHCRRTGPLPLPVFLFPLSRNEFRHYECRLGIAAVEEKNRKVQRRQDSVGRMVGIVSPPGDAGPLWQNETTTTVSIAYFDCRQNGRGQSLCPKFRRGARIRLPCYHQTGCWDSQRRRDGCNNHQLWQYNPRYNLPEWPGFPLGKLISSSEILG